MQRLWTLMQNTANTKANILITGETGVGKSAVAKTIHAMSNRADGPFIEVNCAVLHENLIESELSLIHIFLLNDGPPINKTDFKGFCY